MKATTEKETNRARNLEIRGVAYNGMSALILDLVCRDPLAEATNTVVEGRQWVSERVSTEVTWPAGPSAAVRIDAVKGTSWFARLVRACLRGTVLELADDRLPIAITQEIKDAMKGRVIRASLSTDPRSGRVRIEKRSIELVPLAQPVPQPSHGMTPIQLEML